MADNDITLLLNRAAGGDRRAADEAFERIHGELRAIARGKMRRERPGHTLTPTALVHEAYIKLVAHPPGELQDRKHFFALAARAMRQVLVTHAEKRSTAKRGADQALVTFEESKTPATCRAEELLDLDRALKELHGLDATLARVVEYRFFGGLEQEEIAALLDVSVSTVGRQWRTARAWLRRTLDKGAG